MVYLGADNDNASSLNDRIIIEWKSSCRVNIQPFFEIIPDDANY
jgi:hypothetical protein